MCLLLGVWAGWLSVEDWRRRRLPNALLLAGLLFGLAHAVVRDRLPFGAGTLDAGLTAALGLVAFLPFYRRGWMGAGDVKLIAVIGWLGGLQMWLAVLCYASLLAGLMAVLLLSPNCRPYLSSAGLAPRLRRRIPFGSGLALAFLAVACGWLEIPFRLAWPPGVVHA